MRKEYPGEVPVPKKMEAARAVIAREKTQAELAEEFGVSRQAVHQWVQLYRLGVLDQTRAGRGRPKIRNLTADEGRRIKAIILKNTPEQAGFKAKSERWDYEVTRRLIARETGVKMTYRIVADHMERWNLPHGPNVPNVDDGEENAAAEAAADTLPENGDDTPKSVEGVKPVATPPPEPLPEFPRRKRGRPRKIEKPKAADSDADIDEIDDTVDFIDYDAEVEKSRQFLENLKRHTRGGGLGKHAKQRRTPFQPGKKKKKRK